MGFALLPWRRCLRRHFARTLAAPATGRSMPTVTPRSPKKPLTPDPVEAARLVGLHYVRDDLPGIRRVRRGKGFRYVGPDGKRVRDAETLGRIRALVIPPAWEGVWICPFAN